jgi:hypothetical protein
MKWKSKITGAVFITVDCFVLQGSGNEHRIAIYDENDNLETDRPRARLTVDDLLLAFERIEQ